MRFNVTLDDEMGKYLTEVAASKTSEVSKTTEVDLIRYAVQSTFSPTRRIMFPDKKFSKLTKRYQSGFCCRINPDKDKHERVLLINTSVPQEHGTHKITDMFVSSLEAAKFVLEMTEGERPIQKFESRYESMSFTGAKIPLDELLFIIAKVSDMSTGMTTTYTLEHSRETCVMTAEEVAFFFEPEF